MRGILFDMDGVVHVGDSAVPGARETLERLEARGIPCRFVTNTTTSSPAQLHEKMRRLGLPIAKEHIRTTHEVATRYLEKIGNPACYLLVAEGALDAYAGVPISTTRPDCVIIGDIGSRWNYDILNRVFNMVMDGADIIALHKGRYWKTQRGLQVDIGLFVAGLEYCTGKSATVVGKPSPAFFEAALADLGLSADDVVMVGDDIENDVGGAQRAGMRGVLVKTGKYREDAVARSRIAPDAVLETLADLNRYF